MTHPLVEQLRFTRRALIRAIEGVSPDEALQQLGPMNSISWIVGHLGNHEQRCWFERRELPPVVTDLNNLVGSGMPASTPSLDEMWSAWKAITEAADPWLDSLTTTELGDIYSTPGPNESIGTTMLRVIYHYWYHIGESQAIRQMLGHTDLPRFVGPIGEEAPWRPSPSD